MAGSIKAGTADFIKSPSGARPGPRPAGLSLAQLGRCMGLPTARPLAAGRAVKKPPLKGGGCKLPGGGVVDPPLCPGSPPLGDPWTRASAQR